MMVSPGESSRAATQFLIRLSSLICACALSACGSVIDPAPYSPTIAFSQSTPARPGAGGGDTSAACSGTSSLAFADLQTAATTLGCLSQDYATRRNALMQQNAGFIDLPLAALGTATVANPIFHGATAATTALGLATAVVLGGKSYLGVTARIQVLHNASAALQCGASVAAAMNGVKISNDAAPSGKTIDDTLSALADDLANATADKISQNAITDATTATTGLNSAKLTLDAAPQKLSQWASSLISAASNKQFSGVEDTAALLQAIKNAGPSQAAPTSTSDNAHHSLANFRTTQQSPAAKIKLDTDQANYLAAKINAAWTLQSCSAV